MAEQQPARSNPAAAAAADQADPSEIVCELAAFLAGLSGGKLEAAEIDPAGHLFDFGYVDSLSAVEFVAHIEGRYGVRLDDVELVEELYTLEAIAARLGGGA